MVPFQQRNATTIGLVGLALIFGLLFLAFRADKLPLIGAGDIYHAEFSEIGGLEAGDEVRMAGVSIGKVESTKLDGDKVIVDMRLKSDARIGTETEADVKIRTLLGAYYVAFTSKGPGDMPEGETIPVERTRAPYDVVMAFTDLTDTTAELDLENVSKAIKVLGEVAAGSPKEFASAIDGLGEVSRTLAARDAQINELLTSLDRASKVLNSRSGAIETLLKDSNELFAAVAARRDSIHKLLEGTITVSNELQALVKGSRADLKPALDQLTKVTELLEANVDSFDEALRVTPAFFGAFADTLGSGPWFDVWTTIAPQNLGGSL